MESWEILKVRNIWKCSIFRAGLLEIEDWSNISYADKWLICLSCARSVKYFLTKYLTVACNVGQNTKNSPFWGVLQSMLFLKQYISKNRTGNPHISYHWETKYYLFFLKVLICFWNWHLGSCQFGAEIWENW